MLKNFRKNLRYLRRKNGFGQPLIAAKFNKKSYTTIQKWESGETEPSLKEVYILADMYNVNIDDFVKIDLEERDNALTPHAATNAYISESEQLLLNDFRKLNPDGQNIAAATLKGLASNPDYYVQPKTKEAPASSA